MNTMTLQERARVLSLCAWRRSLCKARRQQRQQQAIGFLIKASRRAEKLSLPHVPQIESSFEVTDGVVRELLSTLPAMRELAKRSRSVRGNGT